MFGKLILCGLLNRTRFGRGGTIMETRTTKSGSILDGLDEMIDGWLGVQGDPRYGSGGSPAYFSRTAAIDLSDQGGCLGGSAWLLDRGLTQRPRLGTWPAGPAGGRGRSV